MTEELAKLREEVVGEYEELTLEMEKQIEIARKVAGEACGHCATCRWWDEAHVSRDNSLVPRSYCHKDPVSMEYPPDSRRVLLCDWCGGYEFFEK